jgi:N utilization substance protein B
MPSLARRSRAREVALQLLFQYDFNPAVERPVLERFARERLKDAELERFCLALYDGAVGQRPGIDRRLTAVAENWRLPRMAAVDRNVLRLGAYELLFTPDTPPAAALNEAIELARRYGSKDSPAFVNGVLDRVKSDKNITPENTEAKKE